jgi:hypothetical protein
MTVHVLPGNMAQQDFRIRHKVESHRDVFLGGPARKLFNMAFLLGPIGHFAGAMRELRVPAPHDPTVTMACEGNPARSTAFSTGRWTGRLHGSTGGEASREVTVGGFDHRAGHL